MRLRGKVAIVTGGSRGIGAAVCEGFAREGALVVVNYHQQREQALALVERIEGEGGQAIAVQGDISAAADVQRMVAVARDIFGPVDILVANAAYYPRRPWHEIPEAEWDRVMDVNVKGAFLCAQAVYADMRGRGGSIITVSSVTVELGWKPYVHYVASKAALIGMTRALAREAGRDNIRVNCVMPGAIRTDQEVADFPNQASLAEFLAERQCLARRGEPADMVGAFLYLASSESAFVTGQVINVDGGWVHY
jgi:3-oxoacyl-[acyl-carrier protein] reductase